MSPFKAKSLIFLAIILSGGVAYFLFAGHSIKLMDELEVFTNRITAGQFWHVIQNEEAKILFCSQNNVELPTNDFKKYNLLVSDGRRILKLSYRIISKYQWNYHFFKGEEVFDSEYYPHSMFVYRIKKIYLHKFGD